MRKTRHHLVLQERERVVPGFGVLCVFGFDYKHKAEAWHHSLSLLKNEVMPRLAHLGSAKKAA